MCYSGCKYEDYWGECRHNQCRIEDKISNENNTVYNIIINYMKQNKYDGLCCDGCGCGIDDIAPCGELENMLLCSFAYKITKETSKKCKKLCKEYKTCEKKYYVENKDTDIYIMCQNDI